MKILKKRMSITLLIVFILFISLLTRLLYVQIFNSEAYINRAYSLWTRNITVNSRRGNIYDRNGKLIVGNKLAPSVTIIPSQIENKEETAGKIADVLGLNVGDIIYHFNKNVSIEILKPEATKINIDQAKKIYGYKLKGVYISSDVVRYYPYNNILAHVLGFVGADNQGLTGIEYIYNDYLIGNIGSTNIFTDAHGNKLSDITDSYTEPTKGIDLYLTIDIDMQISLERMLDNSDVRYTPEESMGLIMNPKTSEIYAMASRPNYDLVDYQKYDQKIYNRNLPIWKSFEPGSTFKYVTYSAGLEEGVFDVNERFYDKGFYVVDGARIRDWKAGGHGEETFYEVIQNSCNPGFIEIGLRLGKDKLFEYVKKYGYGEKTNIDLLGESTGIVFNKDKIGNVETATTSFGQGISATPIQIVNGVSACVNGGILNEPYILKGIGIGSSKIIRKEKTEVRRVISEETSIIMRDALERVVSLGTARNCYIEGYRVGGKTGTAQIAEDGKYKENTYILSFMGIAPMNDPELVCYIALNHPINSIQYGGTVVAPIVREVLIECINILDLKKQEGGYELEIRYFIDKNRYKVESYLNQKTALVKRNPYYTIEIIGSGDTIIMQSPNPGEIIEEGNTVYLYTN